VIAQLDPGCDDPEGDDLYDVGVIAQVLQLLKLPDGTVRVLVEGKSRARLSGLVSEGGYVVAEVDPISPDTVAGSEVTGLMRQVVEQFGEYVKLNKKLGEDAGVDLTDVDDAGDLADTIAANAAEFRRSCAVLGVAEIVELGADRSIAPALRVLARRGVATVLVESGGGLLGKLLAEGLVDEAWVFVAPIVVGERDATREGLA